jgi:4-hydroxyacetophenone monooxygenase
MEPNNHPLAVSGQGVPSGAEASEAERWRHAVEIANVPTLLLVLVQLTADTKWMSDRYRPTRTRGLGDNDSGGLPDDVQREIRDAATQAVFAWRAGAPVAMPVVRDELAVQMLGFSLGEPIPDEYATMVSAELRQVAAGRSALAALGNDVPAPAGFRVLVIGAGMSGIATSIRLSRARIEHVIVERNATVGGTWHENRYPGCGVDVPSHLYSFSFAPYDWTKYFALRDEIYAYFEHVANEFGVRDRVRFNTEVERAVYDEPAREWVAHIVSDGRREELRANVVVSCVGAFNKPLFPDVTGRDTFPGPQVHPARWPADLDLTGKRVVIVGNGASAMQIVPAIAPKVAQLTIIQRSPHWAAAFEKFAVEVPEDVQFLIREMPIYRAWYRARLDWAFNDKSHASIQKDPDWPHPDRSLNLLNDAHRRMMTDYIVNELGDRQDLLPQVVPTYPPFGKRMLLDNGWYRTLRRGNVRLLTDRVVAVKPTGVGTEGGDHVDADVIIWATGFDVVHFFMPMDIVGRAGRSIHEVWDGDDARAYLGTTVPGFPNLFCLYGPNTQFGHGGSLISVVERQIHYVMDVLQTMFRDGIEEVEVREDVTAEYNERVQAAHENMVWTHQGMRTYYRNSKGRVVVNNPFRIVDVWKWTEHVNPAEYRMTAARTGA